MVRVLIGIFVIVHGLVHLWWVALSQRLVKFEPQMGWTGESRIFTRTLGDSATRLLATVLLVLATVGFVAGGLGILTGREWWRSVTVASAVPSTAIVVLFWDGSLVMIVQKGLVAFLINVVILVATLVLKWPPVAS